MTPYQITPRERAMMGQIETLLTAALIPFQQGGAIPLLLHGIHNVIFFPSQERQLTLGTVEHRTWGRRVPHNSLLSLFNRAGLRVRPAQLLFLYRVTVIVMLMRCGAKVKEVRSLLNLGPEGNVYRMLARAETHLMLRPGHLLAIARQKKSSTNIARRLLAFFLPIHTPDHAAWWVTFPRVSSARQVQDVAWVREEREEARKYE